MSCSSALSLATAITSFHPAFHPHSSAAKMTSLLRWLAFNRKHRVCVFSFALWTAAQFPTQEQLPHVSCKYSPHLLTFHRGVSPWGRELSQLKRCCSVIQGVSAPHAGGTSLRFQEAKRPPRAAGTWRWSPATSYSPEWVSAGRAPA